MSSLPPSPTSTAVPTSYSRHACPPPEPERSCYAPRSPTPLPYARSTALLARLLAVPPADGDTRKRIDAFGFNSLVALEVRYWVSRELTSEISVFDILGAGSLTELGATVVGRSKIPRQVKVS
ncbi:hypothetical protein MMC10_001442 [Thelotrema lepadinum]|nr:hypothetical protein [Thelotrema lepadinum]